MQRFFEGFIVTLLFLIIASVLALGLITLFVTIPWLFIVPILGGLFYLFTSKNE